MTKKQNGITLVALIITIIILLILTGITLYSIKGNNSILNNAKKAEIENKKARYFEEIKLDISEEKIDRVQIQKDELFITSLKNKIEKKDWVSSVIMCDENFNENTEDINSTVLLVITKEEYEIIVNVDNNNVIATVNENSFTKVGQEYKIIYNANTGEGKEEEQRIKSGFSATLKENHFTKENYAFKGWSRYQLGKNENGQEEIYQEGSKIKIEKDTILYAIWSDNTKPVFKSLTGNLGTIKFSAEDEESGISGYAITDSDLEPDDFAEWDGTSKSQSVKNNTEYYIWIKNGSNITNKKKIKIHKHTGSSSTKGECYTIIKKHKHELNCHGPHYKVHVGDSSFSGHPIFECIYCGGDRVTYSSWPSKGYVENRTLYVK